MFTFYAESTLTKAATFEVCCVGITDGMSVALKLMVQIKCQGTYIPTCCFDVCS
jgi:hypothetical protein